MQDKDVAAKPPRRIRRLVRWAVALSVLLALGFAAIPTLLGTAPARRLIVQKINDKLRRGRIELGGFAPSWNRGVVLRNVALVDRQGKTVISAETVQSDHGLIGWMQSRGDLGTIVVDGATVDVTRRDDGGIDLLDALEGLLGGGDPPAQLAQAAPAASGGPGISAKVVVKGGRLRVASPELAEPIVASAFEAQATLQPGKPMNLALKLHDGERSLDLQTNGDAAAPTLTLKGEQWPIAVHRAGVKARGDLVGNLEVASTQGLWSAHGRAVLHRFTAEGPALAGDRLALDSVATDWDVQQTAAGWSVRKLDLKSAIAELTAVGDMPATSSPTRLTGHVDLAAASKLLPHAIPLRKGITIEKGQARIEAATSVHDGIERLNVKADLADLAATESGRPLTLQKPATLSAALVRTERNVAVESFSLKAAGIDASATGDLEKGLKLTGSFDLAAVEAQARELIDMGAVKLAGRGRMAADYRPEKGEFRARLAAEITDLHVAGLTEAPVDRDRVRLDASAEGPRDGRGLPADWQAVRVGLAAGETKLSVLAKADGTYDLEGTTPITTPAAGVVAAKVSTRPNPKGYELQSVHLTATPADPKETLAAIGVNARGTYEPAIGRVVLIPVGPQPSQSIVVGPQGMMVSGIGKGDSPLGFEAVLQGDLSALDRTLAYWAQVDSLQGFGGPWTGHAKGTRAKDGRLGFETRISSPDFFLTTHRGAANLTLNGDYSPADDKLALKTLDLNTAYGRLAGNGTIAEVGSRRLADVSGVLEPRWETLDPIIAGAVEPTAKVRATVRPYHLKGPLTGTTSQMLKGMEGALVVDLASARAFGMELGATPIALRLGGGKAVFDPIETTLNGGKVSMGADLFVDDPNALALRLVRGSRIENAAINKAVSDDVLAFIAPVLAKSSNVSGQVSLTTESATIPILGDGTLNVLGQLVFKDVAFEPGPFATELVSLTGRDIKKLTLAQPLQFEIADGRVKQSGLTIPISGDLAAKIDGSIGFDETLAMRAKVPITPQMLGGNAAANQFVGGTEITVPIGGTIAHPTIDRNGLRVALREAARSMVRRNVQAEAGRLLDRALPQTAGGNGTNNASGGSLGRDAMNILQGVGRDLIQQPQGANKPR
ncbi:hypothetical protein [Paludisphaera rhizosphaerae]|uniref:hypothetical protein n=1 Tax=Paludisphaera rhizosphaerae TaxID=2711216 RepID=UPI0013EDCCE2|nr:hypothetical protein [Paludisphaera rhizosphaerae]